MSDPATGFALFVRIAISLGVMAAIDVSVNGPRIDGTQDEIWLYNSASHNRIGEPFETATLKFMSAFKRVLECLEKKLGADHPLVKKFRDEDFQRRHKEWAKDPINETSMQRVAEVLDLYTRFFDPIKDEIARELEGMVECLGHWHELLEGLSSINSCLVGRTKEKLEEWKELEAKVIYDATRRPVGRN